MIAAWIAALGLAHAGASATAATEALPDFYGDPRWRSRVGVEVTQQAGPWRLEAAGAARDTPVPGLDAQADLLRLRVSSTQNRWSLDAGRSAVWDARGFLRLDGVRAELRPSSAWSGQVLAGRLWTPDPTASADTWLAGGAASFEPDASGLTALRPRYTLGAELRADGDQLQPRLHAAAAAWSLAGVRLLGQAELEPSTDARGQGRATLMASAPLSGTVTGGASLRWEDLPPAGLPMGASSPMDWIAADGYAAAQGWAERRGLRAQAGAIAHQDALGGSGELRLRRSALDVFARGAAINGAHYAGGGLGTDHRLGPATVAGTSALYRLTGLDQRAGWISETRLDGEIPLGPLRLQTRAAGGVDRLRAPWFSVRVSLCAGGA